MTDEEFGLIVEEDNEWMNMTKRERREHAERLKRIEEAVARLQKAMDERCTAAEVVLSEVQRDLAAERAAQAPQPGRRMSIGNGVRVWVSR